jgi:FkbM family methyltransferase
MVGPPLPHETYEWMALLDAVSEASTRFTMLELGAGFGRWTVRAAAAVRRHRPELSYRLVAVEAEPTHVEWLRLHLADNEIGSHDGSGCRVVHAAVSGSRGEEDFYVGDPAEWYGQALVRRENVGAKAPIRPVETVTLTDLLEPLDFVDLIDVDIQGAELEVLREATDSLARVRRVYVETHSDEIDEGLPGVFAAAPGSWSLIASAELGGRRTTRLGEAEFDAGGAQLWSNRTARADRARSRRRILGRLRRRVAAADVPARD